MTGDLARAVHDWRWFFHSAVAEMGIRSSWEPLCALAENGGSRGTAASDGDDNRRLSAARRHARIEYALMLMSAHNLRLVRMSCEQDLAPQRGAFGELGNLAHMTDEAAAARNVARSKATVSSWVDKLGLRIARGTAHKGHVLLAQQIRDATERILGKAQAEYVAKLNAVRKRIAA